MKIKSIRYGFANNSSSSHSIVFLGDRQVSDSGHSPDFGWEQFVVSKRKSKEEYILITLYLNLKSVTTFEKGVLFEKYPLPVDENGYRGHKTWEEYRESIEYEEDELKRRQTERIAALEIASNFPDIFKSIDLNEVLDAMIDKEDGFGYIDHQSVINLPTDRDGKLHIEFCRNLFKVLLENNFVFLGGNDNSSSVHELKKYHVENRLSKSVMRVLNFIGREDYSTELVCAYDDLNDDYILQHKDRGDKIRFSFNVDSDVTKKSKFPELVDLKLLDYCPYKCTFCYQSSTESGGFADINDVKKIVDMLTNAGCMEIAIGGGEPTLHPGFDQIVQYIKSKNMIVAFTTRNFDILLSNRPSNIMYYTDSMAFSCHNEKEIETVYSIKELAEEEYSNCPTIYIQIIPELYSTEKFNSMLAKCDELDFKVTLLGYKEFGFGEKYKPKNLNMNADWIDVVKKYKHLQVGVDSVIVKKYKKELIEAGCDKLMLVGEEGKFSCYIDAVNKTISKSSFIKENINLKLDGSGDTILKEFAKF